MAVQALALNSAALGGMPALEGVAAPAMQPAAPGFAQTLGQAVERVNEAQLDARDSLRGLATGENVDLHGSMIALEEAEIALRAMTSVRDRLIGAYEQVMNMAI
jgi:flagellar hook-basal body complex protein FliE